MSSVAGVRYSNRSVSRSAFQKCMGRVPSDEKIPDDMSAEDKCTVSGIDQDGNNGDPSESPRFQCPAEQWWSFINQWKAERETLRLVYRTPAAELIQTFYCQITSLHGTTQSHSRTEMST